MDDKQALIALNLVRGLGPVGVLRLIDTFGSAANILQASETELIQVEGISSTLARRIIQWPKLELEKEWEIIHRLGCLVVAFFEPSYPKNLLEIHDPPIILYLKGDLIPRDRFAVAVVGSRRASHYGCTMAEKLSRELSERGLTVVSGLARGVDAAAHAGALSGSGRTLAVLGSGLANLYPREHARLAKRIAASGAVISEFPIRAVPHRDNFPRRNRIISGLSLGVLVVEAAQRSGALITARMAMEQGRSVLAVPGRVDTPGAQGTNSLIRDGAKMVVTVDDIIEEFEYLKNLNTSAPEAPPGQVSLSEMEALVMSVLSEGEMGLEALLEKTSLTSPQISSILLGLELKRLIRQLPGGYYARC